jgi:hypothetical protein
MGETLRALVTGLADEPTLSNQKAFHRVLLASEVAVPLKAVPPGYRPGAGVADGQLAVPHTSGPDGSMMLLVYTDDQAALQVPQARAGFRLAGRVVLEMAVANNMGVILSTGWGPAASWAAIPPQQVAAVLALSNTPAEPGAGTAWPSD